MFGIRGGLDNIANKIEDSSIRTKYGLDTISNSIDKFSRKYEDRTNYTKEINGSQEFQYLVNYPNVIKSIKLNDGEILKLASDKIHYDKNNPSIIGLECEDGFLTVNAKDIKRLIFKYSWALDYISVLNKKPNDIEFKDIDKVIYYKDIDTYCIKVDGEILPISSSYITIEKYNYFSDNELRMFLNKYRASIDFGTFDLNKYYNEGKEYLGVVLKTREGLNFIIYGNYSNPDEFVYITCARWICEFIKENRKDLIEIIE